MMPRWGDTAGGAGLNEPGAPPRPPGAVAPRAPGTGSYAGPMPDQPLDLSVDSVLRELRHRADEDFTIPPDTHEKGRHQADLAELGLRVSLTRTRYPNRPDGADQYAVTISRLALDHPPEEAQARRVLTAAFGEAASAAQERPSGPAVRMYRVPAGDSRTAPGGPAMSDSGLPTEHGAGRR